MIRLLFLSCVLALSYATDLEQCLFDVKNNKFEGPCLKLLFSKALGYTMVVASLMLKFPQIYKIVKAGSVTGLSLTSFYVETLGFTLIAAYNVHNKQPFNTYGENIILSVQCCLQVLLYWIYAKDISYSHKLSAAVFFTFAWIFPLFSEILPENLWLSVPMINLFSNFIVKGSQIMTNYKNSSTGHLSFITNFLNLGGTLARIFTTFMELKDPFLLLNYGMGSSLNLIIVFQLVYYWNSAIDEKKHK